MDKHVEVMINKEGLAAAPLTPQMFGNAGKEHMKKYGEINYICRKIMIIKNSLPI